jgi:multidrug transporter EmrE-like cation transporter
MKSIKNKMLSLDSIGYKYKFHTIVRSPITNNTISLIVMDNTVLSISVQNISHLIAYNIWKKFGLNFSCYPKRDFTYEKLQIL